MRQIKCDAKNRTQCVAMTSLQILYIYMITSVYSMLGIRPSKVSKEKYNLSVSARASSEFVLLDLLSKEVDQP